MADNFVTTAGDGSGKTFASDEISGVDYPRLKLIIGADGTNDGDVSSANPLPVTGSVTVDLGANNDVTLAVLPDTAAGDLAALVVDAAAIEALLITIDSDTSALAAVDYATSAKQDSQITLLAGGLPAALGAGGGIKVDGSGTALPVSGTVTANLGTIADVATQTTLATLDGKVTACNTGAVVLAAGAAIIGSVAIDQTTPGTTNAVVASIAAAQTLATVTTVGTVTTITNVVHVDDNGGALTVDGTVTANAGTNLNTSALALEAGGNLAAIATDAAAIEVLLTTIAGDTTSVDDKTPALGQAAMAASVPVVIASNQSAVTVDLGANNDVTLAVLPDTAAGDLAAQTTDLAAIEVLLGTIDADTSALAGAVAGTEVQVDIVASLPAGTNSIGKLAANSGVDIGDVDVLSIAAGTNLLGKISAGIDGTNFYDGTTAITIKRLSGVATDSGANTILTAVAGKKFRVLALSLIATSTTAVVLYIYNGDYNLLGNGTNKITLDMDGVGGPAGLVLPFNVGGWFQTDTNEEALAVNLGGATPVIWAVTYVEV